MDDLARRDLDLGGDLGARPAGPQRAFARGAHAALALILLTVSAAAQIPSTNDLFDELTTSYDAGRHEEVVARWNEVSELVDTRKSRWLYSALTVGESLYGLGRWEECHALIDRVHAVRPELPTDVECYLLASRSRLHRREGRFDLARPPIEHALELAPLVRRMEPWTWATVRFAHLRAVELELAVERHSAVEELVNQFLSDQGLYAEDPLLRAELRYDLARSLEDSEIDGPEVEVRAADTYRHVSEELRFLGSSRGRDRLLCKVQLGLARIQLAAGEAQAAAEHLDDAAALMDESQVDDRSMLATLQSELALALGAPHAELERARRELEAAFFPRVERLAALPQRSGGLGLLHFVELRMPMITLTRLDLALDGQEAGAERGLGRLLSIQALGSLARSVEAPTPSLAELRETLLETQHGMLVYLPAARGSLVFAFDRERIRCIALAGLNRTQRALRQHRGALIAGLPESRAARADVLGVEREHAHELAACVLPSELAEFLDRWSSVSVSGLDVLGTVPFGWLPMGDASHLGTAMAWDLVPSLPFAVARARKARVTAPDGDRELLLVGGVRPVASLLTDHPDLVLLPLSTRVSESLAEPYAGLARLTAAEATPALALEEASKYAVVQFLVHAIQDAARPREVGLVLEGTGDDRGVLWGQAVAAADLSHGALRLALLTACRSGASPLRRGDAGSADLAGAWLAAGAPAVLVAHTDLTWGPTVELSQAFHGYLRAQGLSPAEALRSALADMRVEDERELPFRFGQLEVVGLGQRPVFRAAPPHAQWNSTVLVGGVLGLVAAFALGWTARRSRRAA